MEEPRGSVLKDQSVQAFAGTHDSSTFHVGGGPSLLEKDRLSPFKGKSGTEPEIEQYLF